jgi:integrase
MPRLTKRFVDALRVPAHGEDDLFSYDEDIPLFGIRVKSSGTKSFFVQYRNANGRSRRLTLGRYGAVLTPEEARRLAKKTLADVAHGLDPAAARQADRRALTVAEVCVEYLEKANAGLVISRRGRAKKASTLAFDQGRVDRHIIPLLGRRPIKDVTSADVRALQRDITTGKTRADVKTGPRGRAIVTGGRGAATRTLGLLGAIMEYAVGAGYRVDNPVRGVRREADRKRNIRLDEAAYRRLGSRLAAAERAGMRWQAVEAVRLIALTGCRRGEIEKLRKSEVDLTGQALRLGDSKTGASVRAIGLAALDVLRNVMARSKDQFVFPAVRGAGNFQGIAKVWRLIAGRRLLNATLHTLRHSFASVAEDLGFTLPTIGALLGHSIRGVTSGYIHKLDPALVAAANRISTAIAVAMNGNARLVVLPARNRG